MKKFDISIRPLSGIISSQSPPVKESSKPQEKLIDRLINDIARSQKDSTPRENSDSKKILKVLKKIKNDNSLTFRSIYDQIKACESDADPQKKLRTHLEIAKIIARLQPAVFSKSLSLLGLNVKTPEGKDALIEIIKDLVQSNPQDLKIRSLIEQIVEDDSPESLQIFLESFELIAVYHPDYLFSILKLFSDSTQIDRITPEVKERLLQMVKIIAPKNFAIVLEIFSLCEVSINTQEGLPKLIECFKLAAEENNWSLPPRIDSLVADICLEERQEILSEIAIITAENCKVWSIFGFIKSFGIDINSHEGRRVLTEITKRLKTNDLHAILFDIQNSDFEKGSIEGQNTLAEIVKIIATRDPFLIAERIGKLGINGNCLEGQRALSEIAQIVLDNEPTCFIKLVDNFDVNGDTEQGQQFFIKLAKMAAEKEVRFVVDVILQIGINPNSVAGVQGLLEIAEKLAQENKIFDFITKIFYFIKRTDKTTIGFDRTTEAGQKLLIEMVKIAVRHDIKGTVKHFKGFGIDIDKPEGMQCVLELIKIFAQKPENQYELFGFLDKLDIDEKSKIGQKALIKIGKIIAQYSLDNQSIIDTFVRKFVNKISPEEQKRLREIAQIMISKNPQGFAYNAYLFNFKDSSLKGQLELIEIAKSIALKNPRHLFECYQDLGIIGSMPETKKELMKLVKIIAQKDFPLVCQFAPLCGIDLSTQEGQLVLIKLFKMAAKKNAWMIPAEIEKYEIHENDEERQKALIEMVKFLARECFSDFIIHFAISINLDIHSLEGYKTWREVIKPVAQQSPGYVASIISNIDRSTPLGQKSLIEFMKLIAECDPQGIYSAIENFGIDNSTIEGQKALIEIAVLVIKHSIPPILDIAYFQIKSPKERLKLLAFMLHRLYETQLADILDANKFSDFVKDFDFPKTEPYISTLKVIKAALYNPELSKKLESLAHFMKRKWPELSIESELNFIQNIKNIRQQQESVNWLTTFLFLLSAQGIDKKILINLPLQGVLESILPHRNPPMRYLLSENLVRGVLSNHDASALFIEINQSMARQHTSVLSTIFLLGLGLDAATLKSLAKKIASIKGESGNSKLFDDYRALNALLAGLQKLGETSFLSSSDKADLLSTLLDLNGKPLISCLKAIKGILDCGHENELQSKKIQALLKKGQPLDQILDSIFLESFQKLVPIQMDLNNFARTLGQPRTYQSVLTYAATLNRLPNTEKKSTTNLFATFIEKVSEGGYEEWRYETEGQDGHLATIFSAVPGLKEKWTANESILLTDLLQEMDQGEAFESQVLNFEQLLNNAFSDKLILQEDYPTLYAYLKADTKEDRIQLSKQATQVATKNLKNLKPEEKQKALFEREVITLCTAKTLRGQKKILLKISQLEGFPSEFTHDVNGWLEGIAQLKKKIAAQDYKGWTVEFTDNPSDLLVCVSEVPGSCQRVDGDSNSAKGLLAYLTDGKNKLIEVKDREGKIRARSIIRLLIDDHTRLPVIFLERVYPTIVPEDIAGALNQMAKIQESRLELPLFTENGTPEKKHGHTISSLGGRAPFEYSDSGGGIFPDSQYTISEAYRIGS